MDKLGLEFKLIIAYLIPGTIGLYASAIFIPAVERLLGLPDSVPQGSSILVVLTLAVASGMIINATTWAVVRPLMELAGGKSRPNLDYSKISKENEQAFRAIIDNNFYYYQSYSNMFTSSILMFLSYWYSIGRFPGTLMALIFVVVCTVLFFAAKNSLMSTYSQLEKTLSVEQHHSRR